MKLHLPSTIALAVMLAGPALAQRSLFDQPVQNPPPAATAPAAPPAAPAPAPVAPAPQASAPAPAAAPAEEAAPAPRRKAAPKKPRGPARALSVSNKTPATLVSLEVSQEGRSAKLGKPLAPGKRARLALPAFKACEVSVTTSFEGSPQPETSQVDICKETSLNFKD